MSKARQLAGWLMITGFALVVQGCWEDEQMTLVGEGGCRMADGGHGKYLTVSAESLDQCEARCLATNGECAGFEYNSNNNACEIHYEPIATFENVAGVFCYRRS